MSSLAYHINHQPMAETAGHLQPWCNCKAEAGSFIEAGFDWYAWVK